MKIAVGIAGFTLFNAFAFADAPVSACRVKVETLKNTAGKVNNAGCVISRKKDGKDEFLMVYVEKENNDKGWGFPGGKHASKKNDKKEKNEQTQKIPENVKFDYDEPAPCTAARETHEETGLDVVVEDVIEEQEKFIAFSCSLTHAAPADSQLKPIDGVEIKKIRWVSMEEVEKDKKILRFESNLSILKKAVGKK